MAEISEIEKASLLTDYELENSKRESSAMKPILRTLLESLSSSHEFIVLQFSTLCEIVVLIDVSV